MVRKLYAIGLNTFVETVRQPIYGILTWVAVGWLALNPLIAAFSLQSGDDSKIMKDVALMTMLLFGLLCSVFSAAGVVTREIESFTVLTVVSKPVSRPLFLLGKYLGVAAAMVVAYFILSVAFLMAARHGVLETNADKLDWPVITFSLIAVGVAGFAALFGNYTYGWNFVATLTAWTVPLAAAALFATLCFDKSWKPQPWTKDFGDLQLVYALLINFCGVLILTAFAVALSTRFSQVMTLLLCFLVYCLGLLSDSLFRDHLAEGLQYQLLYAILPNFQFFWISDALTQNILVGKEHVWRVMAYAGTYALAVLSLGIAMFQTREVG
jgi:hypothetical protein